jgi:hypothetical protein
MRKNDLSDLDGNLNRTRVRQDAVRGSGFGIESHVRGPSSAAAYTNPPINRVRIEDEIRRADHYGALSTGAMRSAEVIFGYLLVGKEGYGLKVSVSDVEGESEPRFDHAIILFGAKSLDEFVRNHPEPTDIGFVKYFLEQSECNPIQNQDSERTLMHRILTQYLSNEANPGAFRAAVRHVLDERTHIDLYAAVFNNFIPTKNTPRVTVALRYQP